MLLVDPILTLFTVVTGQFDTVAKASEFIHISFASLNISVVKQRVVGLSDYLFIGGKVVIFRCMQVNQFLFVLSIKSLQAFKNYRCFTYWTN